MRNLETATPPMADSDLSPVFGWELILNLYDCDPAKVRSRDQLLMFMHQLCREILDMKLYGDPIIARFGEHRPVNVGYTVVQLVETSTVVAHCSELKNSVYLEIFSCKPYDSAAVCDFCRHFFDAQSVQDYFLERR